MESSITLTDKEKEIFQYLLNVVENQKLDVTLRVAGGWVRDKLMKLESHDIDIALDKMMGQEFVLQIKAYMESKGEKMKGFGVIKQNTEQAKHLETATCHLLGKELDFVNLRGEEYGEDSRIPQITFGTPLQDAERRDLTINSLFYNINQGIIEDFTSKGIQDLKDKIIRTPLCPVKTFSDDPLRILRTFRFATRLNFKIMDDIIQAARQKDIKQALLKKVSPERIRTEFDKMLRGPNPMDALDLIYQNDLWDVVYKLPQQYNSEEQKVDIDDLNNKSYKLAQMCSQDPNLMTQQILTKNYPQDELQLYTYLSACCLPFQILTFIQKKKQTPVPHFIINESLKFSNKELKIVSLICNQVFVLFEILRNKITLEQKYEIKMSDQFQTATVQQQQNKMELESSQNTTQQEFHAKEFQFQIEIIIFLRQCGDLWELIIQLAKKYDKFNQNSNISNQFDLLYEFVYKNNLQSVYELKPYINGKEIQELFNLPKPGPIIKKITDNVILWQIQNPQANKEYMIEYISQNKEQFQKDIVL